MSEQFTYPKYSMHCLTTSDLFRMQFYLVQFYLFLLKVAFSIGLSTKSVAYFWIISF